MIVKNKVITGTLALIAGVAIGWFLTKSIEIPSSDHVLKKLVLAGEIIDAERRDIAVKTALAGVKITELETLTDPIMKFAQRRPDMIVREEFLKLWGAHHPEEALAYLGSDSLASERVIILKAWARNYPDTSAKCIPSQETKLSDNTLADADAILDGIAEADPVKAILFADRFSLANLSRLERKPSFISPHPSNLPYGSYQIEIDRWMKSDPAVAFKVIISLKSTTVREQALNELFNDWSYKNPKTSQAFANQLWNNMQLENDSRLTIQSLTLLGTLLQNEGEQNGRAAYQRVLGIADPEQRLVALKAALYGWSGWDGERVAEVAGFIYKRLNSPEKTPAETELLIHAAEWTAKEITESGTKHGGINKAAAWLELLPHGEARDAATRGIASAWTWSSELQKKTEDWANALPPSHLRNIAVATYAETISDSTPEKAMTMATTIQEPTLRAKTLAYISGPFIHKEQGGKKVFDLQEWIKKNPKIGAELQATMNR